MPAERNSTRSGSAAGSDAEGWPSPSVIVGLVLWSGCAGPIEDGLPSVDEGVDAAPPAVVIDGGFDDWRTVPLSPMDGPVGLTGVSGQADANAVYLLLRFVDELNVQGRDGPLLLVVDADADSTSGTTTFGLHGADVVISHTILTRGGEVLHGTAAWETGDSVDGVAVRPSRAMVPAEIGLWLEPLHATRQVELRLARSTGAGRLFENGAFRLRIVDVDPTGRERGRSRIFEYRPPGSLPAPGPPTTVETVALERAPGTDFRAVVWNVAGRLVRDPGPASAILRALRPDVVLLDEAAARLEPDAVPSLVADGDVSAWAVHVGTSGGRQRGVIAARGTVEAAGGFEHLAYADEMGGPMETGLLPPGVVSEGIPAAGAWVEISSGRFLAVTVDLRCCGNSATSPEDRVRRIESARINAATRAALSREPGAAVLVVGDFNLVGSREPLETLANGLDPSSGDLSASLALQLDGASTATWSSPGDRFPSGRLDYVLYSASRLEPLRSFVFETGDLSVNALETLGLERGTSDAASDHRPIVVDFRWVR